MDVLKDEVTRFAVDTRHRPHQYETPHQVEALMHKMLASHIRAVPWKGVYLHVSPSDLNRVVARTAPLNIGMRAAPLPPFYVALKDRASFIKPIADGIYHDFKQHVYPKLGPLYEDTDEMKQQRRNTIALYLAKATDADIRGVVKQLYPNDDQRHEKERVYDAVIDYGPLRHELDTDIAVSRELGAFITNLSFPEINSGDLYIVEPIHEKSPEEDPRDEITTVIPTPSAINWATPTPKDTQKSLKENKSITEWKSKHALGANFPAKHVAKQMITMYYAPQYAPQIGNEYLGKFQHPADLIKDPQHWCSQEDVTNAYKDLLSDAPSTTVNMMWNLPQVQSYAQSIINTTPTRELEKMSKHDILALYMQNKPITSQFITQILKL